MRIIFLKMCSKSSNFAIQCMQNPLTQHFSLYDDAINSRALVAEALEISMFMEKMKTNNEADDQLNNLEMGDWAE